MHYSRSFAVALSVFVSMGVGYVIRHALAEGVPTQDALTYSGALERADGTKLTGRHNIEVSLWSTAKGGTTPLCTTRSQALDVESGRFVAPLPSACFDIVKSNVDVWVEVEVDGTPFARSKLGVVPYAIEAGHATAASSAASASSAAGELDDRINMLASQLDILNARLDTLVQTGSVGVNTYSAGWNLHIGDGSRTYTAPVTFPKALSRPPVVTVALSSIDSDTVPNTRVVVAVQNVTSEGFELLFNAWGDTRIYGLVATWTAVAQ